MVDRIKRNLLKLGLFSSLVPFLSSIKTAYAKTSFFDEFVAIKANSFDKVTIPTGFNYSILCKWGDLLWDNNEKKKIGHLHQSIKNMLLETIMMGCIFLIKTILT